MGDFESFDDIVLGGGKGGKSLAMALGPAGHKVALIEQGQIGGTCINVACIPTKTMVASSKVFHQSQHAKEFGIEALNPACNLKDVIARKRRVVKSMVDAHWNMFKTTPGMELIIGRGKFCGPNQIEVSLENGEKRFLSGKRIYINTGSRSAIPELEGLAEVPYLTSTSIMELEDLPEHLVIVGGGYIALEFAQIFCRLGSKVSVILRGERFLPNEDEDIAQHLKQLLEDEGIAFYQNAKSKSVCKNSNSQIMLNLADGRELKCSHLMFATGRIPNTEELNLEAAGVIKDQRGNIKVNDKLETSAENIWAIGDCNGGPLFTHVSWDDYRIIKDNILAGADRSTRDRLVPYTLFVDPELGRVGLTEEQARKAGHEIMLAKIPAAKIPRANTSGESKGILKAVIDRNSKQVLGVSLLCHSAGEIISVVQMAMLAKLPYTKIRDTIFTHPTMAESLNLLFATVEQPALIGK